MSPWNTETAEAYDVIGEQSHVDTLRPTLAQMFGELDEGVALDFGCGPGRLATELARLGARRVIGIDESPRMIARAQRTVAEAGYAARFSFALGDERLLPARREFDAILCSLVLMMCSTRDRLCRTVAGLVKSLAPDGRLIITLTHPCFRETAYPTFHYRMPPDYTYWDSGRAYYVVLRPRDAVREAIITDHHWTLQDYMEAIRRGGGVVDDLRELPANRDSVDPPAYLLLRVTRSSNPPSTPT